MPARPWPRTHPQARCDRGAEPTPFHTEYPSLGRLWVRPRRERLDELHRASVPSKGSSPFSERGALGALSSRIRCRPFPFPSFGGKHWLSQRRVRVVCPEVWASAFEIRWENPST